MTAPPSRRLLTVGLLLGSVLTAIGLTGCTAKTSPAPAAELMCSEHGVPERFCTLCHPDLKSQLLMCREHGVPEDICTLCHPEAAAKYHLKPLCKEHGLPEHLCPKCHPQAAPGQAKDDWCPEHGVPGSLCTRCRPELAKSLPMCAEHGVPEVICTVCRPELAAGLTVCRRHQLPAGLCPDPACQTESKPTADSKKPSPPAPTPLLVVQLAGPDVAEKAGITTTPVAALSVAATVTASGEVGYDETRLAQVRPRVAGVMRQVLVKPGDTVAASQVLATIDSPELGQAKADYLAAQPLVELWKTTLARQHGLNESGVIAGRQFVEAQAELQRSQAELLKTAQRLRNFGLDRDAIDGLAREDENRRSQMQILSPLAGTVIRRRAVVGEAVEAATELFAVADLSRVWIHLDVFEKDLRQIRAGQPVAFRVPGLSPTEFRGEVVWIDTEVHSQTRTIRVRVEAENRQGLLRAHMFGRGEIQVGRPRSVLVVPRDAVQWEGRSYVVFVERSPDRFEPRRVLTGRRAGPQIELAWGHLEPGQRVVATGAFLLKTEIQKDAIGAGCCGD